MFVEGRLQSRSWDAQDGTKRSTLEVVAQSVQFLYKGTKGEGSARSEDPDAAIFEEPETSSKSAGGGSSGLPPEDEIPF